MSPAHGLTLAANQGAVGGGEVMLVHLATAARELGLAVRVVAPSDPGDVLDAARAADLPVAAITARDRRGYLRALRRWDRSRTGLLWCNGLLPATATAGHPDRVVHLHQPPRGLQAAARVVAVRGAREVVVPSQSMGHTVPHTVVLPNWTGPITRLPRRTAGPRPVLGFLGRLTPDKGVAVLAEAVRHLVAGGREVDLVLGGESRFAFPADERRVEAALAPLGGRVRRLGWVPRETFFAQVDLACFPSVWAEPYGLVAAEAMGHGVPFVISDAGALPEVAGPEHPWVARAGDAAHLAAVVGRALDAPDDEVRAVLDRARARWEAWASPEAGRARLADVLRLVGV